MKTIYVKDLKKGDTILNEVFLVSQVEKARDKLGREYLKVILSDKTGKIEGKIWSDILEKIDFDIIKPEKLLSVQAKVDEYKGMLQLTIQCVNQVDESKLDEYISSSMYNPEEMYNELFNVVNSLSDKILQRILLDILSDNVIKRKYMYWPAAKSLHHDFRSGMLQHVLEMIEIANSMKRFYPEINYDLLYAGIILHDIGKLEELGAGVASIDYTKQGSLIGHITLGVMIFEKFAAKYPDLNQDSKLHIIHMILSHHGSYEFGSPVLPSTLEAVCLHYIDNLSSKAKLVQTALQQKNPITGFTDYNKWMGGVILWDGGGSSVDNR